MDDCNGGAFSFVLSEDDSDTSKALSGMTPGLTCRFRMLVKNIIGSGEYSDEMQVTFAEVPDAPAAPTFVSRSSGDSTTGLDPYITIEWKQPDESNGAEILGYRVYVKEDSGSFSVWYDGSSNPDLTQY